MKQLSIQRLSDIVASRRRELKITQTQLANMTGINRVLLSHIEGGKEFTPSINQLISSIFISLLQHRHTVKSCSPY